MESITKKAAAGPETAGAKIRADGKGACLRACVPCGCLCGAENGGACSVDLGEFLSGLLGVLALAAVLLPANELGEHLLELSLAHAELPLV